jgi:hypothetical protein
MQIGQFLNVPFLIHAATTTLTVLITVRDSGARPFFIFSQLTRQNQFRCMQSAQCLVEFISTQSEILSSIFSGYVYFTENMSIETIKIPGIDTPVSRIARITKQKLRQ